MDLIRAECCSCAFNTIYFDGKHWIIELFDRAYNGIIEEPVSVEWIHYCPFCGKKLEASHDNAG